jgi:hypothetical protein
VSEHSYPEQLLLLVSKEKTVIKKNYDLPRIVKAFVKARKNLFPDGATLEIGVLQDEVLRLVTAGPSDEWGDIAQGIYNDFWHVASIRYGYPVPLSVPSQRPCHWLCLQPVRHTVDR